MQNQKFNSTDYKVRQTIFAAMIGDALGSTLEFQNSQNAKSLLLKFSNFKNGLVGGGAFKLCPGQFTDDTEMALAIMSVISKYGYYDQKLVANAYHQWYLSNPFDIGKTTANSVSQITAEEMIKKSQTHNSTSLSNGFLMRLYGLVALYHNKSFDKLTDAIAEDVCLTHSHPETVHIAIIYGTMLWQAINGSNANDIYQWGKKYCNHSPLFTALFDAVDNEKNIFSYNGEKYTMSQIDTHIFGFVGFALWLLLRAIKKQTSYANAILEVVSYGGDTDTNACIVGAVMGALYPDTIPAIWINNLLSCSAKNRYKQYPIADPKVWLKWLP